MSVKTFWFQEMLALTGENAGTLRNDRRFEQTVAAFGATEPSNNNKWLLVDFVAMQIRDQLTDLNMKRKTAALIVRAFFDQWVAAVSRAEYLHQAMLFATADHGDNKMWAAFGPANDFRAFLELLPEPPKRLYTVDVSAIMDNIQRRAKKATS